jgi:serine-type D-Ala-D-Ala carboxypeptidase/endopeptidase
VPAIPSQDAVRRMLADRLDDYRLSLGMIVGTTDGKSHLATSYGRCDVASGRRIDEATIFEIGSVTKLFTALLLAEMANRGEVQLDEPVVDLLPSGTRVPSRNGREITLRDLASHYSGFPRRPTNLTPNDPSDPYAHYTADHLYEFLATYD